MSDLETLLAEPFPWDRPDLDPPEAYALMREERPIVRVMLPEGKPVWLITRYEDVRKILVDPRASADDRLPGYATLGAGELPQAGFVRMDDPMHSKLRNVVVSNFNGKRVTSMRADIQSMTDSAIDAMLASPTRPVDLVSALAVEVPSQVLCILLGVPKADRPAIARDIEAFLGGADPDDDSAHSSAATAVGSIMEYLAARFAEELGRQGEPSNMLGQLAHAYRDDEISYDDALGTGLLFITAGYDTVANAAALGVLSLLTHPDQLDEIRDDPSLLPAAIEEVLRYHTHANLILQRTAIEDIPIGDVVIPAGEHIFPLNFSADRDPQHYPEAEKFDIHRNPRDHLAFGYGAHRCIGAALGRLQLDIMLRTLFHRIPGLRLAVPLTELPFKRHARVYGLVELPVTW